jgi:hypothetical protein
MKKDTPTSEPQHPIDVFFREQEADIPVVFNPAHWDALEAMLDQAAAESRPAPGARHSDSTAAGVRASNPLSWKRLLGLVLASLFLATVPAADPALQSRGKTGDLSVSVAPTTAEPAAAPSNAAAPAAPPATTATPHSHHTPAALPSPPAETDAAPETAFQSPALDTAFRQSLVPASLHHNRPDSLAAIKELPIKQDSIAEQKKKKKHLFW